MYVRTPRTRLLAATAVALVALTTLTACEDGEGVRDEGPSSSSAKAPWTQQKAHAHTHAHAPERAHNMRAASVAQ